MSNARFKCPNCHQEFAAPPGVVGKVVRCLKCGAQFQAGTVQPPPPVSPPVPSKWEKRLPGILFAVLFVGGLLTTYLGLWEPLEQMRRREPRVTYSSAGVATGPLLLVCSLALPFIISRCRKSESDPLRTTDDISRTAKLLLALLVLAPMSGTSYWFNRQVEALGYQHGSLLPRETKSTSPLNPSPIYDLPTWRPKGVAPVEELRQEHEKKWREIERALRKPSGPTKPSTPENRLQPRKGGSE